MLFWFTFKNINNLYSVLRKQQGLLKELHMYEIIKNYWYLCVNHEFYKYIIIFFYRVIKNDVKRTRSNIFDDKLRENQELLLTYYCKKNKIKYK